MIEQTARNRDAPHDLAPYERTDETSGPDESLDHKAVLSHIARDASRVGTTDHWRSSALLCDASAMRAYTSSIAFCLLVACSGSDGAAGPSGTPGSPGTPGATGPAGPAGPSADAGTATDAGVPELVLEGDYIIRNSIDLELLQAYTKITGSLLITNAVKKITLPNLRQVGQDLGATNATGTVIDLGEIVETLDLPNLERVEGRFFALGSVLTNVPSLKYAGGVRLKASSGTTIHIGALEKVGGEGAAVPGDEVSYGDSAGPGPNLTPIPLTALKTVKGRMQVGGLTSLAGLEKLTSVTQLDLRGPLTDISALAGLTDIDRLFVSCKQLTSLSALTGITKLDGGMTFDTSSLMPTVGLPNLVTTGGIVNQQNANVGTNTGTVALAFPKLTTITNSLTLENETALTTLDFPMLTTVTVAFTIRNNSALKQCTADALRAQITTAPTTTTMTGNTGAGTCP